jgi:ATP-dependent Clp protease protease subunit
MSKFWKFTKAEAGSELILDGVIASESWWEDEVTPKMFRDELAQHPGDVTVRINSPGGDVSAGVAIYNYLTEHDGTVTVKVDGIAASIASLISMAGDKIIMLPGSMMMVHNPWTIAAGNSDDMAQVVEMLEKTGESMVPIYAARTGLSEDRVKELLKAETWMTAQDAVDLGFADEAVEAKTSLADAMAKISSLTSTMQAAVMQPVMSMKARKAEVSDAEPEKPVETPSEEPEAPVETETQEVATETTEVTEPVAEEIKEPVKENVMTEQEKIAASQVLAPQAQANPDAVPKPSVKDYLKTSASMDAFARILEDNAGKSSDDVRAAWKSHLEVKAGVTNPEIFLPETLITEITDAFTRGGEIWNRVTKTGADVWRAAWDSNTDPDQENGRAAGYNREEQEVKREQELTFAARILRPQMIYKYITLNREDVKNQRSTGALVRFVLAELPRRIIREVERAIVIGDGRAPGSDYKIQEGTPEGFFPIKADATANNAFATTYTPLTGENNYAAVVKANDLLEADGTRVLISKKGYVTEMKLQENANGGYIFPLGANFASILEVDAVIQPDWMASDTDNDAYLVVLPNYRVVGDSSIEAFTNFLLSTNKQEYLQEIWAGGGLTVRKTAVAIAAQAS